MMRSLQYRPQASHEELTTPQRVFDDRLPELARFQRHAAKLSIKASVVSQKNVQITARSEDDPAALDALLTHGQFPASPHLRGTRSINPSKDELSEVIQIRFG